METISTAQRGDLPTRGTSVSADDTSLRQFLTKNDLRARQDAIKHLIVGGLPTVGPIAIPKIVESAGAAGEVAPPVMSDTLSGLADLKGPPFQEALLPLPEPFIGRSNELEWVLSRLRDPGTTRITALSGMGGIGKTGLAAVAIRALRNEGRFNDGIAVVSCLGVTSATEILRQVLAQFDPLRRLPESSDTAALTQIAHRYLDEKDALIVLDNIEPALRFADVIGPLRATGATLLVTARHTLPRDVVPSVAARTLALLSSDDALDLFARTYGRLSKDDLTDAERRASERIVRALRHHTLAIRLTGATARDLTRDLDALAQEIEDALKSDGGALYLPDAEATDTVSRVLRRSYESLPEGARRVFAALSVFESDDLSRNAAIALAKSLGIQHPVEIVNLLVLRALADAVVNEGLPLPTRERLRLHPLLSAVSAAEFAQHPRAEQAAARNAMVEYFVTALAHLDQQALEAEYVAIGGAIRWAQEQGQADSLVALCAGIQGFWSDHWLITESLRYLPGAAAAAATLAQRSNELADRLRAIDLSVAQAQALRRSGRPAEVLQILQANLLDAREWGSQSHEATILSQLGQLARAQGDLDSARELLHASLDIRRELGDRWGEGLDLSQLGQISKVMGEYDLAQQLLEQSLSIRRSVGDVQGEGVDLSHLGQIAWIRGRLNEAERLLNASQAICERVGDRQAIGMNHGYLGRIARATGRLDEAERQFQQSLEIAREVQDRRGESAALAQIGRMAHLRGQLERADDCFRQSLRLRRETGDRRGEGWDLGYLGRIARERGLLEDAEQRFEDALRLMRLVKDRPYEAELLHESGQLARLRGDTERAKRCFESSLAIRQEVGDRRGEGADLGYLGRLAHARGDLQLATAYFTESLAIAREIHDRRAEGIALSCLGQLALDRGDSDVARDHLEHSLTIRRQVQDRRGEGVDLSQLGRIALSAGQLDEAERYFSDALSIARVVQNRQGENIDLYQLAHIAMRKGDVDRAEHMYSESLATARRLAIEPDIAQISFALGRLLIEHRHDSKTGCSLMREGITLFTKMEMAYAAEARAIAESLGCGPD